MVWTEDTAWKSDYVVCNFAFCYRVFDFEKSIAPSHHIKFIQRDGEIRLHYLAARDEARNFRIQNLQYIIWPPGATRYL